MLKRIIERIKKFIKDYIIDDDPYEKLIRYNEKTLEDIETPFIEIKKKRGRPKLKK